MCVHSPSQARSCPALQIVSCWSQAHRQIVVSHVMGIAQLTRLVTIGDSHGHTCALNHPLYNTLMYITQMWPFLHKPTIPCKTSKSSFLHHPLTELLLITTMFFFFPSNLSFSSYMYTTVSVIQLKINISRNVCFQFVFVLHLLIAQEIIASFLTNAYKVSEPNFARSA